MSIRFNGNVANYLSRTSSLPDYNANYTIMAWIKIVVDLDATTSFLSLATSTALNFDRAKFDSDGTTVGVSARNGATVVNSNGTNLTVETWRHVTMRRAGAADLRLFLDVIEDAFSNTDVTGRAANDNLNIGRVHVNTLTIEPFDGEMAYLRIWTTDLTTEEMAAERVATAARKTSDLYGDYPLANSASAGDDISGNGNHLTVNGTITTGETAPPIITGPSLFRGRNFLFFDDEEVNRFEFWPAVEAGVSEHERSVALDAVGSVVVAGESFSVLERAATLDAAAALETASQSFSIIERSASVAGAGEIAADGARVVDRSVVISTTADITASGESFTVFQSAAALSGAGSIEVAGSRIAERSALLTATATIESSAQFLSVLERAVQLAAIAAIESAAEFFSLFERQALINGVATVTVTAQTEQQRQAAFSAVADVSVSGVVVPPGVAEFERSVALSAAGSVTTSAAFFSVLERTVAFTTAGNITVSGQSMMHRTVSFNCLGTVSVSGEIVSITPSVSPVIITRQSAFASPRMVRGEFSLTTIKPATFPDTKDVTFQ